MIHRLPRAFLALALALLPAWAAAANAGTGIPGVYAIDTNLFIIGTKASGNACSVDLDASGINDVVTLNGQAIAYPAAEIDAIYYFGGRAGSDSLTLGAGYGYQAAFAYLYSGHNTAIISAHECEILLYGDYNAITAPAGGTAICIGENGAHDTFTGSGALNSTVASSNVYTSTLPGVYDQFGQVTIPLDPTRANRVTVAPGSGGTTITINGASDTIPASFTVGSLIFTSGLVDGDSIAVTVPNLLVKGWLFPDQEQVSLTDDVCQLDAIGNGDSFTGAAGSSGGVTIDYDGATKPSETFSATLTNNTFNQGGPMVGTSVTSGTAGSSIPGVFAIDTNLLIIGTKASGNTCSVDLDASGENDVVTLNGQAIEYPAAEVTGIYYFGGRAGSDTLALGVDYSYQAAFAYLYSGHNTATVGAHECEILLYGDYNAITAPAGGSAIVIGENGAHDTFTGSGALNSTVASSNVYTSTLPGVYDQFGQVTIPLDPTRANRVTVAPGSGGTTITINGASDTIPASFTVGSLIFTSGLVHGDSIAVTVPNLLVKGWLFPDQEQVSLTDDVCQLDAIGNGDSFTGAAGSSGGVTIAYNGATKPSETFSASLTNNTFDQGGPTVGTIITGGTTGTSSTTGTSGTASTTGTSTTATSGSTATGGSTATSGTGSAVAAGGGSSGGCGLGSSLGALVGLALAMTRRRRGMA